MSDDITRALARQNQLLRRRLEMLEEVIFAEPTGLGGRFPGGGVVDPVPTDLGRIGSNRNLTSIVAEILRRLPPDISPGDPPPFDLSRLSRGALEQIIAEIRGGVGGGRPIIRFPEVADPAPTDLGRMSKAEIESQLELARQTRLRLETLENTLNERLRQIGPGG